MSRTLDVVLVIEETVQHTVVHTIDLDAYDAWRKDPVTGVYEIDDMRSVQRFIGSHRDYNAMEFLGALIDDGTVSTETHDLTLVGVRKTSQK